MPERKERFSARRTAAEILYNTITEISDGEWVESDELTDEQVAAIAKQIDALSATFCERMKRIYKS